MYHNLQTTKTSRIIYNIIYILIRQNYWIERPIKHSRFNNNKHYKKNVIFTTNLTSGTHCLHSFFRFYTVSPRYDDVLGWCWVFLYSFIYFWADDWLISININLLMHFTHALNDYVIISIAFLLFRLVCFIMAIPVSWNHVSSHFVPQFPTTVDM